jgi:nitrate/nitrite transport system permease protein
MVSAVFHSPRDAAKLVEAKPVEPKAARATVAAPASMPAPVKPARDPFDWRALGAQVLPPLAGLTLLVGIC